MRYGPIIGIILLLVVAIAVAAISSKFHPGGELPPGEQPDTPPTAQNSTSSTKNQTPNTQHPTPTLTEADREAAFNKVKAGAVRATLQIDGKGTIVMELYPQAAPKTVAHFLDLVKKHFYDGIKIHRVEPDFVVQMGDPDTKNLTPDQFEANGIGSHGSGTNVPLEAKLPHIAYSIGLARSQDPDSGDSQFYINLKDNAQLDGSYCVFGRVIQGQDVATKLQIGDTIKSLEISGQ